MSKLIVSVNSINQLNDVLMKDIYGVMLYVSKLSVNSSFYINVDDIDKIDFNGKKIYLVMNKIMHNSDLVMVREVLNKIKNKNVHIMFYDMAVYNISRELNILDKLVIFQDHLNASILSNKFYYDIGIKGSYITSDITLDELLDIKSNCNMDIYFLGYGYSPIFYSRRYLVNNYLEYTNNDKRGEYRIISDTGVGYPIVEEEYGTTIYTHDVINLINYMDKLSDIDYIILNSNMIDEDVFNSILDNFIDGKNMDDAYIGFLNTKTVFKVKNS